MPIKLWWWVSPLFLTGWITFIFFSVASVIADKVCNKDWIPAVLAAIAIAPWVICGLSVVVLLVTNILIFIWR